MKTTLMGQRSKDTKYCIRFTESFPINIPAKMIDLQEWFAGMMETDYTSYSQAHIAMSSFSKDGILYTTNVENIGTDQIVQHYIMQHEAPDHVLLYSPDSVAYIMRFFPITVGVPWEMQIRPVSKDASELVCLIGIDYPNKLIQIVYSLYGLGGLFLRKHLNKEGKAFAKDIEKKFNLKA